MLEDECLRRCEVGSREPFGCVWPPRRNLVDDATVRADSSGGFQLRGIFAVEGPGLCPGFLLRGP